MTMFDDTLLFSTTIFTPHAAEREDFLRAQSERLPLFGNIPGWHGTRFFAEERGRRFLLLSSFTDAQAQDDFAATPAFQAHRATLLPMLEGVDSQHWRLVLARDPGS
ncbi:putative quinol monooxygenase [Sphingopyxis kveilinensis]|uniref:putative quinol monooxygenase n=1 Tax=Sphingopyxis kveilinensis TaxID=3114367 RepID=UPI0030CD46F4